MCLSLFACLSLSWAEHWGRQGRAAEKQSREESLERPSTMEQLKGLSFHMLSQIRLHQQLNTGEVSEGLGRFPQNPFERVNKFRIIYFSLGIQLAWQRVCPFLSKVTPVFLTSTALTLYSLKKKISSASQRKSACCPDRGLVRLPGEAGIHKCFSLEIPCKDPFAQNLCIFGIVCYTELFPRD